ncbi:MFS transporter [Micromonospora craniellae]|uniref:MFS transporter n=1 Tax=Micromonospora craniellae TaxID=2294034 RepID=UPI0021E0D267|nr:MFS transporter [Micromonospora craniellae]
MARLRPRDQALLRPANTPFHQSRRAAAGPGETPDRPTTGPDRHDRHEVAAATRDHACHRPCTRVGTGAPTADDTSTAQGDGILAGLRWLVRQPMLRTLVLVTAAVAAADTAWFAIFVLYARDALGLGALGFGLLLATGATGGLIGSFAADRLVARLRHRHVLTWSMAVTAGVPALLAVTPHRAAAVVVVVTTSAAFAVLNVAALSVRQRLVPGGLLGRVIAATLAWWLASRRGALGTLGLR